MSKPLLLDPSVWRETDDPLLDDYSAEADYTDEEEGKRVVHPREALAKLKAQWAAEKSPGLHDALLKAGRLDLGHAVRSAADTALVKAAQDAEEALISSLNVVDLEMLAALSAALDAGEDPGPFIPPVMVELAKAGNPDALRRYWREDPAGKVKWNTGHDWTRCVASVSKYMTSEQAKGFCAIRHHEATGMWPGDKRNVGKYAPTQPRQKDGKFGHGASLGSNAFATTGTAPKGLVFRPRGGGNHGGKGPGNLEQPLGGRGYDGQVAGQQNSQGQTNPHGISTVGDATVFGQAQSSIMGTRPPTAPGQVGWTGQGQGKWFSGIVGPPLGKVPQGGAGTGGLPPRGSSFDASEWGVHRTTNVTPASSGDHDQYGNTKLYDSQGDTMTRTPGGGLAGSQESSWQYDSNAKVQGESSWDNTPGYHPLPNATDLYNPVTPGRTEMAPDHFVDPSAAGTMIGPVLMQAGDGKLAAAMAAGEKAIIDNPAPGGVNSMWKGIGTIGGEKALISNVGAVDQGYGMQNEVAAGHVNKAMGGMVDMPGTVIGRAKVRENGVDYEQDMAFTEFAKGKVAHEYRGPEPPDHEYTEGAAFDIVIGNSDRHFGNYFVEKRGSTGHLVAIDHTLSFESGFGQWNNASWVNRAEGKALTAKAKAGLKAYINDTAAHNTIRASLNLPDAGLRVQASIERAQSLLKAGRIPAVYDLPTMENYSYVSEDPGY